MSFPFDKHEEGCRPFAPCRNCQAVAFLKSKLTDADIKTFDSILVGGKPERISQDTKLRYNSQFQWTNRTASCLFKENIKTIADLVRKGEDELCRITNFGQASLGEVIRELAKAGWKLGDLPPNK